MAFPSPRPWIPILQRSLGHFSLFARGHSRKVYNVMQGNVDDVDVTIMDYKYATNRGRHRNTTYQTVVLFRSDQLDLPQFTLRREHVFHKLAATFGHQDIDFDDYPTFPPPTCCKVLTRRGSGLSLAMRPWPTLRGTMP